MRDNEPAMTHLRMKLVKIGVRYCIRHHGIANEDDSVCDFSPNEDGRCNFRQTYLKVRR